MLFFFVMAFVFDYGEIICVWEALWHVWLRMFDLDLGGLLMLGLEVFLDRFSD